MATQMHIDAGYAAALSAAGLKDFESVMRTRAGVPVSVHADRSTVRLQIEGQSGRRELYLKRTRGQPVIGLVRDLLFGRGLQSRPVREYVICKRLEALGIPAAKAIAWGQRKRWLLPRQGFVLVDAVPGRMTLEKAWGPRADGTPRLGLRGKRQVIRSVARVVARLHGMHLGWPDLVSKHILLDVGDRTGPTKRPWPVYLIDVERVETSRSKKRRQRDLVKLLTSMPAGSVSGTDRLRFALAYCGCEQGAWSERRAAVYRQFDWAVAQWPAAAPAGNLRFQGRRRRVRGP